MSVPVPHEPHYLQERRTRRRQERGTPKRPPKRTPKRTPPQVTKTNKTTPQIISQEIQAVYLVIPTDRGGSDVIVAGLVTS